MKLITDNSSSPTGGTGKAVDDTRIVAAFTGHVIGLNLCLNDRTGQVADGSIWRGTMTVIAGVERASISWIDIVKDRRIAPDITIGGVAGLAADGIPQSSFLQGCSKILEVGFVFSHVSTMGKFTLTTAGPKGAGDDDDYIFLNDDGC